MSELPGAEWWALSYAKVHTRTMSTKLTKALNADTDKHRMDLVKAALDEAQGILQALGTLVDSHSSEDPGGLAPSKAKARAKQKRVGGFG